MLRPDTNAECEPDYTSPQSLDTVARLRPMQSFTPKKYRGRTSSSRTSRIRPQPAPLDPARLNALALAYVARFATSAGKLEAYLLRKLKGPTGAGWQRQDTGDDAEAPEEPEADIDPAVLRREVTDLVARFVAAGYVDDQAFAAARSGGLQRRGYGRRHIAQTLGQAGIAGEIVAAALPGKSAGRQAALMLARKRRLGPFGAAAVERGDREKQIAVLLRAGHPLDSARNLVNATSIAAAEDWARPDDDEEEEA